MGFPTLPPYTIPEADADLWNCGTTGRRTFLKECARCGDYFEAVKRHHALCCTRCKQISALVKDLREKARKAPYEPVRLTADQVMRLNSYIRLHLDRNLKLHKPLDPEDGFRVVGYPYVGIRRVFIRGRDDSSRTLRYLRRSVVEIHPGAAVEAVEKILESRAGPT